MRTLLLSIAFVLTSVSGLALKIQGIVKDDRNQPLRDVAIVIEGAQKPAVYSSNSGSFTVSIEDPAFQIGNVVIFNISKDGFEPLDARLLRQAIPNELNHIELHMKKSGFRSLKVFGYIENDKSQAIVGATVTIAQTGVSAVSGPNGMFLIPVDESFLNKDVEVRVDKENYFANPKTYSVILNAIPIKVQMNLIEMKQAAHPELLGMSLSAADNSKSIVGLNYFHKEGNPTAWFERAKSFQTRAKDFGNDSTNNIGLIRSYDSRLSDQMGPFGLGWIHNYSSYIDMANSTVFKIIFVTHKGTRMEFKPLEDQGALLDKLRKSMPEITGETALSKIYNYETRRATSVLHHLHEMTYVGVDLFVGELKVLPRGFQLHIENSFYQLFDREGKLENIEERDKLPVKILYDPEGRITAVANKLNFMKFKYDGDLVSEINYKDAIGYKYQYDGSKRLVDVTRNEEPVFKYSYGMRNKLTHDIGLKRSDTTLVEYNESGDRTSKKNRQATVRWSFNEAGGYQSVVQHIISQYQDTLTYRYVFEKNANELEMIDSDMDTARYKIAGCGCATISVLKGRDSIYYDYDHIGRLVEYSSKKDHKGKKLSYDIQFSKVDSSVDYSYGNFTQGRYFRYNVYGLLEHAASSDGFEVALGYDTLQRISKVVSKMESGMTTVDITYNSYSKPELLTLEGTGTIRITYKADKSVDKIETVSSRKKKDGDKESTLSKEIMRILQDLIDVTSNASQYIDAKYKLLVTAPSEPCSCIEDP